MRRPAAVRVLAVSGRPLDGLGGAERSLARLCGALARRCRVTILAPGNRLPMPSDPEAPLEIRSYPDGPDDEGLDAALNALPGDGDPPEIIYLPDKAAIKRPERLARLRRRCPSARVVFKESTDGKLLKLLDRMDGPAARAVVDAIDSVVCVSSAIESRFRADGRFADRLVRIPNGVDTARFSPVSPQRRRAIRQTLSLPDHQPVCLFAGRFADKKNLDVIYGAWLTGEKKWGRWAALVLVGAPHKPYDEEIIRLMTETLQTIRVVGPFRRDDEMVQWMRAADVFLAPTSREGLSNAFLEACSCGLYPVVSTASGYGDVITDETVGIRVEERNTSDVIRALDRIRRDPETFRERGRTRTRAAAVDGFDLDRVADAYLALFKRLTS